MSLRDRVNKALEDVSKMRTNLPKADEETLKRVAELASASATGVCAQCGEAIQSMNGRASGVYLCEACVRQLLADELQRYWEITKTRKDNRYNSPRMRAYRAEYDRLRRAAIKSTRRTPG